MKKTKEIPHPEMMYSVNGHHHDKTVGNNFYLLNRWMTEQGWIPFQYTIANDGSIKAHWEDDKEFANVKCSNCEISVINHHLKSEEGLEYFDYRD